MKESIIPEKVETIGIFIITGVLIFIVFVLIIQVILIILKINGIG